jgi:hypothetical protein
MKCHLHIFIEKEIEELGGGGEGLGGLGLQLKTEFLPAPQSNSVAKPAAWYCQYLCDHSLCIFMVHVHPY